MSVLGTGIDIIENYRLNKLLLKKKSNFKNKIFTNNEIAYCEKNQILLTVIQKDLLQKKLLLKLWVLDFGRI